MRRGAALLTLALGLATNARSQTPSTHPSVPLIHAVRASTPIAVDGRLDEEVWLTAPAFTQFIQRDPDEGKPASEQTEMRVAYDAVALYVGVRLRDREPARIARQLVRRDGQAEADAFSLYLDPHHDHLTGASFGVSAAGVQSDSTVYNDTWQDDTWDAVWESAVTIDADGWALEMRIPYSQLRFPAAERLTFGINAMRYIQRKKEQVWLVEVPKNENGLASRFAHLDGMEGVSPHHTAELLPYVASRAEFVAPSDTSNPFNDGTRLFGGAGIDLKYGLSSNLSLDGTINPDFGQVEVDPAVVNLTAFETFFQEKRPFFIEGANTFSNFGRTGSNNFWGFNRAEPQIFYSRRIGRAPQGSAEADFVDTPSASTILGAAKLTGKTRQGWSVGLLEAVTGRERAHTATGDLRAREEVEVEPLSNYFVGRAQREIGRAGVGVLATAVNRDLQTPALTAQLPDQAYVAGVDGHLFLDRKRNWVTNGSLATSHVAGSTDAMSGLQRASQRYFDRPDADHVEFDPAATSLNGWTGSINLNRQSGVHGANAALWAVSPGFDSSDAGFTFLSDRAGMHAAYQWRNPKVTRFTRERFLAVAKFYTWNYGRELQSDGLFLLGNVQLKNYWTVFGNGGLFRAAQDDRATRGGPSMLSPSGNAFFGVSSDSRKRVSVDSNWGYDGNDRGGHGLNASVSVHYRPSSSVDISTGPSFQRSHQLAQYVDTFTDPVAAETFGARYVFATLDQREFSLQTRVNVVMSPRMSLQVYMQPLVSVGDYTGFKQFARPRTFDFLEFGRDFGTISALGGQYRVVPGDGGEPFTFANPNFNFKSLRLNAIYRWEWKRGSAMYLVWTQQREDVARPGHFELRRDITSTFTAPADDVILFKIAYWFQR